MNRNFFNLALCLTLSLGATNVYSQASSGQQKKATPSATKPAATQQVQQTPKENPLIGKTLESPEFKALKLTQNLTAALRDEGSSNNFSYDVYEYVYFKNGSPNRVTARIFLVNPDNLQIMDELVWEKKMGIEFASVDIWDAATDAADKQFIKCKLVKQAYVILAYYECKNGKFVEKKPKATWENPEDLW